ncbi:ECF-type sigma factor [Tuwongella immobilis]|uniref:RNA polymerase sigma-70 ECF-like HTH domain-containing protein n=1 Tax=Tuwongella immobilis TaxID=692036 RepID=A0A6C2YLN9_9BACT|nr:ECF-type sigma factor [Tuwongella immobilis]VIP02294.1 rna polymerase sigma-70 ecf-like protein : DNA-directed RNA polymerase specialized sigma subunit, sigma24 OS=Singulisphaera acidiphila (strain ATCC BAA-1392 / DSM 18658 / VKM B-2454 / MOB10) GN=Sinac_3738 PE=4 SV=1: Sigma70_ECF [Tuwongella immobilis]VTS00968.1 rna polymerase sigma-70 ecf-like protein : DNA-directed RNA polymerase specialized sigma subunit, sigma24 OS=Singulisphaera acidiphila (strain ATCC BAA-1392 / DSM 18658 / VKM B-2454 
MLPDPMDLNPEDWDRLAEQMLNGDEAAISAVFQRFAQRLLEQATARLDPRLRAVIDPEDIVLSAFRSFLIGWRAGRIRFIDWQQLWGLLALIVERRCIREAREQFAQRNDRRRERSLQTDESGEVRQLADSLVSPENLVELRDLLSAVRAELQSDLHRAVFDRTLEGFTVGEISDALNYYDRGVERIRAQIRQILIRHLRDRPAAE